MAAKTWQEWPETCENCEGRVEVLTEAVEEGSAFSGDPVRCVGCGCTGVMECDPELYAEIAWEWEEEMLQRWNTRFDIVTDVTP